MQCALYKTIKTHRQHVLCDYRWLNLTTFLFFMSLLTLSLVLHSLIMWCSPLSQPWETATDRSYTPFFPSLHSSWRKISTRIWCQKCTSLSKSGAHIAPPFILEHLLVQSWERKYQLSFHWWLSQTRRHGLEEVAHITELIFCLQGKQTLSQIFLMTYPPMYAMTLLSCRDSSGGCESISACMSSGTSDSTGAFIWQDGSRSRGVVLPRVSRKSSTGSCDRCQILWLFSPVTRSNANLNVICYWCCSSHRSCINNTFVVIGRMRSLSWS